MTRLPELMDCRMIQEETGLSESAAETIMRRCDLIRFGDVRKAFVRRADVLALMRVELAPERRC